MLTDLYLPAEDILVIMQTADLPAEVPEVYLLTPHFQVHNQEPG
jgi:hypothetical protein